MTASMGLATGLTQEEGHPIVILKAFAPACQPYLISGLVFVPLLLEFCLDQPAWPLFQLHVSRLDEAAFRSG